jgi:hypothetical protein
MLIEERPHVLYVPALSAALGYDEALA